MKYDVKDLENMDKNELIAKFLSLHESFKLELQEERLKHQEAKKQLQAEKIKSEKKDEKIKRLETHIAWLRKQLFGKKSEKIIATNNGSKQLPLFEDEYIPEDTPPEKTVTVKEYEKKCRKKATEVSGRLQYDDSVEVIEEVIEPEEIKGLSEDKYEVIGEEVTEVVAQVRGYYRIKRYIRKKYKIKDTKQIVKAALPTDVTVLERSIADVSLLSGLVIDKFRYHLPLYRIHQRLLSSGIKISRGTLTNFVHRTAELLEPVYRALQSNILQSKVVQMDETPVKAGNENHKMKNGYYWVVHGDGGTSFLFSPTRSGDNIKKILKDFQGIVVSDGYKPYETFAINTWQVKRAQCWAHVRRKFFEALETEPELSNPVIEMIRELYCIEGQAKSFEEKKRIRSVQSSLIVDRIFEYLRKVSLESDLVKSSLFYKAVSYAFSNERALRVFLDEPSVPLDNNTVERANRYNAVGRKNYMFHWTEVGAQRAAILYSLVISCISNGIDPYEYLIDVLKRIQIHPAKDVDLLTPALWKDNFSSEAFKTKA